MSDDVGAARGRVTAAAVAIVLAFAFAYFLSALLRAVTATLAPVFSAELGLSPADLGLLSGVYFLGFASLQLPLGRGLDRFGPRQVQMVLLGVAVIGCFGFALAQGMLTLSIARLLIGMGVAACLMAPLTFYCQVFDIGTQLRLNSWMLMTGSIGMLTSTLPVQWLLPVLGWRGLFLLLAVLLMAAMLATRLFVPPVSAMPTIAAAYGPPAGGSYREIMRHPRFVALAPLAFFCYGGMIAIQALWAGPWLTQVSGHTPDKAAAGLFAINLSMLLAFMSWGLVMPRLARSGIHAPHIVVWSVPASLLVLAWIVLLGPSAGAAHWAAWCVLSSGVSLSQPAVGQAFPTAWAGRALSAYNLIIFGGVFCLQWGIGLGVDAFAALGWSNSAAFQGAVGIFAVCSAMAYLWFLMLRRKMAIIEGEASGR